MDKQIMDLSSCSSPPCTDFIIDLMKNNHQTQQIGDKGLEEIVPSYDFQPLISPTTAVRVWSASDFKPISTCPWSHRQGFASMEPDKDQNVSEIDRAMKKHTDTLLHVLEGVSARLTLLETTTHNLENLLRHLKLSLDKTHATTDAHMAHLNDVLVEVRTGVLLLKDKQEIVEAQLHLSSHHVSKVDQLPKTHSLHDFHPTALSSFPQPPPSAPAPSSQLLAQLPTHFSPPPKQPPPSPTLTSYQSPPTPSSGYCPEEQPPYPLQSYPPNPPPQPQPSMYDGARGRSTSAFPSGYSSQPYPHTASPMPSAKPPHVSSSGTGYPHLSNGRVPIDDVIDRVTTMGFPREQVRATVRKLTENGQAVDLNVVLDKLMNQGRAFWFAGR